MSHNKEKRIICSTFTSQLSSVNKINKEKQRNVRQLVRVKMANIYKLFNALLGIGWFAADIRSFR